MKPEYRNISSSPGNSFRVKLFENKEFPAAWHFHPQYELTYIKSSEGMRYVGNSIRNFKNGDLVLIGKNLPHCWKTIGLQKDIVRAYVVQWEEDLMGTNWLEKEEFYHISQMLKLSTRGMKFGKAIAEELKDDFAELTLLPPFEKLVRFLFILNKLAHEEKYDLLSGSGFSDKISLEDSKRMTVVYSYVKDNYKKKFSLKDVSSSIAMSEENFCRFFKRSFNKPFFEFVNEYKINIACKLIIETDNTISRIAYECGYNNLTFFHRQFQKLMNVSPGKYRKLHNNISVIDQP
ncbi:AraC family transcriptional regulator [Reichenbachiella sp. MALMAid0571]|uniref:AraC family transcriptional regulator n=1 Tax=Reichenbachiella sp. MALMAid0571 TaxID=3143939 RepID=UPI0032DF212E